MTITADSRRIAGKLAAIPDQPFFRPAGNPPATLAVVDLPPSAA